MANMLVGVRVLDLSRLLPGPFCTQLLADLGAEVIKVEMPGEGDYSRSLRTRIEDYGTSFLMLNRGKKSMTLNLKAKLGPEVFRRLAGRSDVVVEGFRPGVVDRLGIGYQRLKRDNPKLIYLALTGYGQSGPYVDRPGHDVNYISYAGLGGLTGPRGGTPVPPGMQTGDIAGGALMAAFAIMGALYMRERTGRGQYIDVAMLDGLLCMGQTLFGEYLSTGKSPGPAQMRLSGGYPVYGIYETKDKKYVAIGALEKKFWDTFCKKAGRPELKEMHYSGWDKERNKLEKELKALFKTKTRDEWDRLLSEEDTCCSPVLGLDEIQDDPQVKARNMIVEGPHPEGKPFPQVAFPIKFSEAEPMPLRAAPRLGEHTDEMLANAGYSKREIKELKKQGVV